MIHNVVELKHGNLKARLLFCNRAYRDSRPELGSLFDIDAFKASARDINFLITYLYNSYLACCRNEKQPALIEEIEFDEAISMSENVPESESNLFEIIEKATESFTVYFGVEVENIKKKLEEVQKNPQMMNSNNSSVENLDTSLMSSGTVLAGESLTTS
jgi:hypothetical protein